MNKPVLVTGASGFIGRRLAARLEKEGLEVLRLSSAEGDLRQEETWARSRGRSVDHVYHLAGRTYVPESWVNPALFFSTNVLGTANALEFCRQEKASLTFASAYVYGRPERLPVAESAPAKPDNPYAQSKYLAEQLCRFYSEHFSVPVGIARTFNVYGPGQSEKFLIPTVIRQAREAPEIVVQDISPKRDFVFVDDVVDALVRLGQHRPALAIYNIASGTSVSVREVVALVQRVLQTNKPIRELGASRQGEIQEVLGDAGRVRTELGWTPVVSLQNGISAIARPGTVSGL